MENWKKIAVVVLPIVLLLVLVIVFLRRLYSSGRRQDRIGTLKHTESLQSGISKLHLQYNSTNDHQKKRRTNYYVFRRGGLPVKPLFSWSDYPSLVTEAVEYGWSRFAFTGYMQSLSSSTSTARSVLLGLCSSGDYFHGSRESEAEISWEICNGSVDFMQKIKLNSGVSINKKGIISSSPLPSGASSVIKTALPLPGPSLGNYSFPQEAYFEITILSMNEADENDVNFKGSKKGDQGEKTKLMQETEGGSPSGRSDSLTHITITSSMDSKRFEELKAIGNKEETKEEGIMMSLGLAVGGTLPSKLPGSYPGSIGLNSNGSVYLEGTYLMFESHKAKWGTKGKVIGCGFNPDEKKVYFTVDSELVHVIHCKSEEFGGPLFPTLAANVKATVLINFGQAEFRYEPANAERTPNPCFIGALGLGNEDSQELFSLGRINSQTYNHYHYNESYHSDNVSQSIEGETDTDDFYDISLEQSKHTGIHKSEV
ncbi:hypothetical protein C5167_038053 [Papaver somniferum]|uniref:SPRY domain-containing protein n=1 Tax=Papaver somniferum TaxID=3469 RepID=A0A4Y7I830_PAPSO|nr:uncharacterized protein LOC113292670 [Papaver somniferum]RZC45107.1 hypothetical protein C5167_038053 [Papaver somniferum]